MTLVGHHRLAAVHRSLELLADALQPSTAGFARKPFREALTVELAVDRFAPDAADAASDLTELAHERAGGGHVVPAGRSFPGEAREELADARNYLVWHHGMRFDAGGSDDELEAIERAIASLAVAWQDLARVVAFEVAS